MTRLREIKPPDTEVRQTLESVLEAAQGVRGVIVIGMNSDNTTFLRTSIMSGFEKSYLVAFANAWNLRCFRPEGEEE